MMDWELKPLYGRASHVSEVAQKRPYYAVVRAELVSGDEKIAVLAKRYGISEDAVRKWRNRTSFLKTGRMQRTVCKPCLHPPKNW